jgi:hypothetical protein
VFIPFSLSQPEPATISFGGEKWDFPSDIEDAVNAHELLYKPPGYYYKKYPTGMETVLDYYAAGHDFANEYQPKEILFSKKIHSYIFRFENKAGVYDSLRQNLEKTYRKKFVFTTGKKESRFTDVGEFAYDFLTVSPEVTVGIKTGYSPDDHYEVVTVRFMYDLSLGRMGVEMGNY